MGKSVFFDKQNSPEARGVWPAVADRRYRMGVCRFVPHKAAWPIVAEEGQVVWIASERIRVIVFRHMFEGIKVQLTELAGKLTHLRRFL